MCICRNRHNNLKSLEKPAAYIVLIIEILSEGVITILSIPTTEEFLTNVTIYYSLLEYSIQFKLFPTLGVVLAIAGVIMYTYYAIQPS